MADGTVLYPDFSATPSESCFASRALAAADLDFFGAVAPCGALTGALHGTSSDYGGGGTFFYVMSVSVPEAFNLTVGDLCTSWGYRSAYCANQSSALWLAYEANQTSMLRGVSARPGGALRLAPSDEFSFQYFTLAPVPAVVQQFGSGFVFLGERSKWIGASTRRFRSVTTTNGMHGPGLRVAFRGAAGEVVTLMFADFGTFVVTETPCTVGESLEATLVVSSSGSPTCEL
jgi:hypothetical protein